MLNRFLDSVKNTKEINGSRCFRILSAAKIINTPMGYKLCEGCESILYQKNNICPSCSAYRFDENISRLIQKSIELANREQLTITDFS